MIKVSFFFKINHHRKGPVYFVQSFITYKIRNDYRLAVKVDPAEAITTQTTAKIS